MVLAVEERDPDALHRVAGDHAAPASPPATPFSTAGMNPPGITPPLIAFTNSKPSPLAERLDLDVAVGELAAAAGLLLVAARGPCAVPLIVSR